VVNERSGAKETTGNNNSGALPGPGARALGGSALLDRVRRSVEDHLPATPREADARQRILRELTTLHRPFDESGGPVHVTGSGVIVGRRGTVLHLHRRLRLWVQPGGHLDPGEGPDDAALRESEEETGLALTHPPAGPRLIHLDVHLAAKGHTHLDFRYLLLGPDTDPAPPPGESPEARWYSWEEALSVADAALVDALHVARAQPEAVALERDEKGQDPGSHGARRVES
jgi:8-oxo-dGTP pyrophosphatase MutT (NUDIX family)